jgi:hypothetical protein
MVVALSLTIVVGSAQRSTPLSNKAPQQQAQSVQQDVIKVNNPNLVQEQVSVTPFNYLGSTEVLFSYDKPMSNEIYDPSKFPAPKQGGENFATALAITSLPYTDNGTTTGYVNDYDAVCPYTGSTSPDVVYSYTPATNKTIQVSLCNDPTNYDSKLYIMDAAQTVIACNDDYCSTASFPNAWVSYIGSATLTGGTTYYIVVDGYGGASGVYQLTVNEVAPCIVTCPGGSTLEGEGTIPDEGADNFNGGCNSTPNVWSSIVPGQTVCGTSNTYTAGGLSSRDTDWYRFDGTSYGAGTWTFTWTAQAEFDLLIFIIKTNGGLCTGQTFWSATGAPCVQTTVTQTGLANDIFDFWVGPSVFSGYPPSGAPYDYVATLTGTFTPSGGGPANDDCANAQVISAPYPKTVAGTLVGATIDCPGVLDWNAVWYKVALPYATNAMTVDFCGTAYTGAPAYGIVYYTMCGDCANYHVCDAYDFTTCADGNITMTFNNIAGPGDIWFPAYIDQSIPFTVTFNVVEAVPCVVTCPGGASQENEPTIPDEGDDVTNGGCNSAVPVFTPITVGQTYCGTANTYLYAGSQYRDTDWYRLDLTGSPLFWDLTWTVTAEFPLIIFMVDAGTENCSDYTILGNTTAAPCVTASLTFTGLQPKVYWVLAMPSVFTGVPPSDYVATLTGVGVSPPVATFNPTFFDKQVSPGGSTSDVLAVGNTGGIGLNYTANVVYPAKATAICYPQNVNYWTGSTTTAAKTQVSQINIFAGSEQAWAQFDVSSIPAGATVLSATVNWYVNTANCPYQYINALSVDPVTATPAALYSAITGGALYTNYSTCPPLGWNSVVLGGNANADLTAALGSGKFGVGFYEYESSTYYWTADGWAEANKPYLTVEYTTTPFWLTINGGQSTSGSVAPGGSNNINVGFNGVALTPGTYTANIVFATNEAGAKASHIIPVTFRVGYRVYGNVYYGETIGKPMATNTTITLTPGSTIPTGVGGAYEFGGLANGPYLLTGATTKPWGGMTTFDATLVLRYAAGVPGFGMTDLQKRAADVNKTNTAGGVTTFDATLILRRAAGILVPQWTAPTWVFEGPYPSTPEYVGKSVSVSGADVNVNLRALCSGDVNGSYTLPVE